jgi:hypothetical protein
LVELLVATAVFSMLMVALVQIAGGVANTWSSSNGRTERRQNGRAVVDFIGRELRAAALPAGTLVIPGQPNLQFVVNPTVNPPITAFENPNALFWQAPLATDSSQGDMAVIGYFVRWTGNKSALCRLFVNPTEATPDPADGITSYEVYDSSHLNNWINSTIIDKKTPASSAEGYVGLFADNVIGFWARPLSSNGVVIPDSTAAVDSNNKVINPPSGLFDSASGYIPKDTTGNNLPQVLPPALPASMEISVVLLDARAASQITTAMVSTIKGLVAQSKNAADFMNKLAQQKALSSILSGASAHQLRVYLENAP